jgi:FMN phosphatase YigB (HAD superfamily)
MTTDTRTRVGLLVVDLDDTLWTWFDAWHQSFSVMLAEVTKATGIPEEDLLPAIKAVHEQKGTTEYSWLLDELPLLADHRGHKKAAEVFEEALHAQNSARKKNTALYPGVRSTLQYVKSQGVKIVAYTESLSFWTEWRVRNTGLDGLIDVLYSSPDHDFPEGETAETVRTLPDEDYGLKQTRHLNVARGIAKPDPQILKEIIQAHAVAGQSVVYVGDSLDRDVEMAVKVGVISVHAKYGETYEKPGYDLLRKVTHWKPAAVEKETSTDPEIKVTADYVLDDGFYQLLALFDFTTPFNVQAQLDIWKEAVGVQMHFNDIGWRIRALALTVLTFTLGAVGFVYINTTATSLGAWRISPALFVPILGAGLWGAFWFVDRGWFHKLLVGSVLEGADQEKLLTQHGVMVGLGAHITEQSHITFKHWTWRNKPVQWRSSRKLNLFYGIGMALLGVTLLAVALYGPRTAVHDLPQPAPVVDMTITPSDPAEDVSPPGP